MTIRSIIVVLLTSVWIGPLALAQQGTEKLPTSQIVLAPVFVPPSQKDREAPDADPPWVSIPQEEFVELLASAWKSEQTSSPFPEAFITRGAYTARLAAERSADANLSEPGHNDSLPLPWPEGERALLRGTAEFTLGGPFTDTAAISLGPMNLAVERARWEENEAVVGSWEDGSAVVIVPAGQRKLSVEWSAKGQATPNGWEFSLQLPRSAVQVLHLDLPPDRTPRVSAGDVERLGAASADGWHRWRVIPGESDRLQLRIDRATTESPQPLVLVAQETTYEFSSSSAAFASRFHLRVLYGSVQRLEFRTGGVQIIECRLIPVGPPAESLDSVALRGQLSEGGETFLVQLPEPVRGPAQIVLRGMIPLVRGSRWPLPQLQLTGASGPERAAMFWQQHGVALRVVSPLVLTDLQVQHGRQQAGESLIDPQGEVVRVQLHRPEGRILVAFDVQQPQLTCDVVNLLRWSADELSLTSTVDWQTDRGRLFRLGFQLPAGWQVSRVESYVPGANGTWQLAEMLQGWSVIEGPLGSQILQMPLSQALRAEGPRRTVIHAWPKRGPSVTALKLRELLQLRPLNVHKIRGVIAFQLGDLCQVRADKKAADLLIEPESAAAARWRQEHPNLRSATLLRLHPHQRCGTLHLMPRQLSVQVDTEVHTRLRRDGVDQHWTLHVRPLQESVRQLLIYFPTGGGQVIRWHLQQPTGPELKGRRLPSRTHPLWDLPSSGELWELELPQPRSRAFRLVARDTMPYQSSHMLRLPIVSSVQAFRGVVWLLAPQSVPFQVQEQGMTSLPTPSSTVGAMEIGPIQNFPAFSDLDADRSLLTVPGNSLQPISFPKPDTAVVAWSYQTPPSQLNIIRAWPKPASEGVQAEQPALARAAYCTWSRLESVVPSGDLALHRITYQIFTPEDDLLTVQFPEQIQPMELILDGDVVRVENEDSDRIRVPLKRSGQPHWLTLTYRVAQRANSGGLWTRAIPLGTVPVPVPKLDLAIPQFYWDLVLPADHHVVKFPENLRADETDSRQTLRHRLLGPLARPSESGPFHPLQAADWQALVETLPVSMGPSRNERPVLRSLSGVGPGVRAVRPDEALLPSEPAATVGHEGLFPAITHPSSEMILPQSVFRISPEGWKRFHLRSSNYPRDLRFVVAPIFSLTWLKVAGLLLGLVGGALLWSGSSASRSWLLPIAVAAAWSIALVLPAAVEAVGICIALGVLMAVVCGGCRRMIAHPARTMPVEARTTPVSTMLILVAVLWGFSGATLTAQDDTSDPEEPPAVSPSESHAGRIHTPESRPPAPQVYEIRIPSDSEGKPDPTLPLSIPRELYQELLKRTDSPGFSQPSYVITGGQYEGTADDHGLRLRAQYTLHVLQAPATVRLPLGREARITQCRLNDELFSPLPWSDGEGIELELAERGIYKLDLDLAPLWHDGEVQGEHRCRFRVPSVPTSEVRLRVPDGLEPVDFPGCRGATVEKRVASGREIRAFVGPVSTLEIRRRPLARPSEGTLEQLVLLDMTSASRPRLKTWLRYQSTGRAVRYLYWWIGPGLEPKAVLEQRRSLPFSVTAPSPGGPATLVIDMGRPVENQWQIYAEFEMDLPGAGFDFSSGRLRVPELQPLGVTSSSGTLILGPSGAREIELLDSLGLQPLRREDLAQVMRAWPLDESELLPSSSPRAYRFQGAFGPFSVAVRVPGGPRTATQVQVVRAHTDHIKLRLEAEITVNDFAEPIHRFRLSEPMHFESVEIIDPPGLLRRTAQPSPTELILFLNPSRAGTQTLRLRGVVPREPEMTKQSLPTLTLADANRQSSQVLIFGDDEVTARLTRSQGLVPLSDTSDLKRMERSDRPIEEAYRAVDQGFSGTLEIRPRSAEVRNSNDRTTPPGQGSAIRSTTNEGETSLKIAATSRRSATPEVRVRLADVIVRLASDGRYLGEAAYLTTPAQRGSANISGVSPQEHLRLQVPADVQLLGIIVDGQPTPIESLDNGDVTLTLPTHRLPRTIQVHWQGRWPGSRRLSSQIRVPLPRIGGLAAERVLWTIHWPTGWRCLSELVGAEPTSWSQLELARLEVLLEQARALAEHHARLPFPYLSGQLTQRLDELSQRAGRFGRYFTRLAASSGDAHSHIQADRGRLDALTQTTSRLASQFSIPLYHEATPRLVVAGPFPGLASVEDLSHGVTFAITSNRQVAPSLEAQVMSYHLLEGATTAILIAAIWGTALLWIFVIQPWCSRFDSPVLRTVAFLAFGVGWWLWLVASALGLVMVLMSPLLGWWTYQRSRRAHRSATAM